MTTDSPEKPEPEKAKAPAKKAPAVKKASTPAKPAAKKGSPAKPAAKKAVAKKAPSKPVSKKPAAKKVAAAKKAPSKPATPAKVAPIPQPAKRLTPKLSGQAPTVLEVETQLREYLDGEAKRLAIFGAVMGSSKGLVSTVAKSVVSCDPDVIEKVMAAMIVHAPDEFEFYRTPVGLFAARVFSTAKGRGAGAVSRIDAGVILGVTTGTVAQLVARGTLETAEFTVDGVKVRRLVKASVLCRLGIQGGVGSAKMRSR